MSIRGKVEVLYENTTMYTYPLHIWTMVQTQCLCIHLVTNLMSCHNAKCPPINLNSLYMIFLCCSLLASVWHWQPPGDSLLLKSLAWDAPWSCDSSVSSSINIMVSNWMFPRSCCINHIPINIAWIHIAATSRWTHLYTISKDNFGALYLYLQKVHIYWRWQGTWYYSFIIYGPGVSWGMAKCQVPFATYYMYFMVSDDRWEFWTPWGNVVIFKTQLRQCIYLQIKIP